MTTDPFTETANAAAREYARTPRMNVGTVRDRIAEAHLAGSKWGRDQALAQEPTDAAQIIDQHRQDGRSVGYGVTVHCACGAESWGYIDGSRAIDDENNSHREADRKYAAHVADMLARAARRDEETP